MFYETGMSIFDMKKDSMNKPKNMKTSSMQNSIENQLTTDDLPYSDTQPYQ